MSVMNGDEREGGDPPCWAHLFDDASCPGDDSHQRQGHTRPASSEPVLSHYSIDRQQPNQGSGHCPNEDPTPRSKISHGPAGADDAQTQRSALGDPSDL